MFKILWQNIKTTLVGAFAGSPLIQQGVEQHNYAILISGIATLILGLVAKDATNRN